MDNCRPGTSTEFHRSLTSQNLTREILTRLLSTVIINNYYEIDSYHNSSCYFFSFYDRQDDTT